MKRFFFTATVSLLLLFFLPNTGQAQKKVYLMHPTVWNIENTMWLVDQKLIDLPDAEFIGVCYSGVAYDYSQTEAYIQSKGLKNCSLIKTDELVEEKDVYAENAWSPLFREIVANADAIIFFGGPDIQPSIYNQKQHLLTDITDPGRHRFEVSLFFQLMGGSRNPDFHPLLAAKPDLVVRAICLGMQTMNVAAGGTLIQDIPQQTYQTSYVEDLLNSDSNNRHRNYNTLKFQEGGLMGGCFHPIIFTGDNLLSQISRNAEEPMPHIYSSHHQAAGELGAGLKILATSPDGKVIEALQHDRFKNVVGLQFHPEPRMLFDSEAKAKITPTEAFSPYEYLKTNHSMAFHRAIWKDFSDKINHSK